MNRKILIIILSMLVHGTIRTKESFRVIRREKDLYKALKQSPFVVALFITLDKKDPNKNRMFQQKSDFAYVGSKRFYQDGNVQFLIIDVSRSDLNNVARVFHVTQLPTIILFKYDLPLINKEEKLIRLKGFSDAHAIDSFIDDNLGDYIDEYIEQMAQIRQEERERLEEMQQYNNSGVYFGVGFPGWWGGYPACNYSWPYNTGYGYNCGYYGGYFFGF